MLAVVRCNGLTAPTASLHGLEASFGPAKSRPAAERPRKRHRDRRVARTPRTGAYGKGPARHPLLRREHPAHRAHATAAAKERQAARTAVGARLERPQSFDKGHRRIGRPKLTGQSLERELGDSKQAGTGVVSTPEMRLT